MRVTRLSFLRLVTPALPCQVYFPRTPSTRRDMRAIWLWVHCLHYPAVATYLFHGGTGLLSAAGWSILRVVSELATLFNYRDSNHPSSSSDVAVSLVIPVSY